MVGQTGASVSAVLQLQPSVTREEVVSALGAWLQKVHGVDLESAEHDGLMVEWRASDEEPFACQLVASDSKDGARRTVTVACDEVGAVSFIEETPFAAADAPLAQLDLSQPLQLLLGSLTPLATSVLDLPRGELAELATVDPIEFVDSLSQELAPGLLLAVTPAQSGPTSHKRSCSESSQGSPSSGRSPLDPTC